MTAPTDTYNLTGAVIFWLYIIFALLLTGLVVHTIHTIPAPINRKEDGGQSRDIHVAIYVFATLALISFTVLSYNMLEVLIQSYYEWAQTRGIAVPKSIYGMDSLVGPRRTQLHLWQWSTTSTLFQDFAEELVGSEQRWTWAMWALWVTFINMHFIGSRGHFYQIPHLWAFFVLGQILPTSFTQNLFFLALLKQSRSHPEQRPAQHRRIGNSRPWLTFAIATLYLACIQSALWFRHHLLLVILIARSLLFAPLVLGASLPSTKGEGDSLLSPAFLTKALHNWVLIVPLARTLVTTPSWSTIFSAANEHPAVSALVYDLGVSVLSWFCWYRYAERL